MIWLFKLYRVVKGALYYRFSIFICLLGASFMAPQLWEGALWLITRIFDVIYQGGEVERYKPQSFSPDRMDYVIGTGVMAIGIAMFFYYYKKFHKRKNENNDYLILSSLWINLRNIHDKNPNRDDLKRALGTLNTTGTVLLNTSDATVALFKADEHENFTIIYNKLMENDYIINGKNTKDLVKFNTKLAKKLLDG